MWQVDVWLVEVPTAYLQQGSLLWRRNLLGPFADLDTRKLHDRQLYGYHSIPDNWFGALVIAIAVGIQHPGCVCCEVHGLCPCAVRLLLEHRLVSQ